MLSISADHLVFLLSFVLLSALSTMSYLPIPPKKINKNANEIFFVFTLSRKHHSRIAYASGQEILGCEYIELYQPFCIEDVESFMVEVEYEDGRRDTNLPLNLSTKRHGVEGDVGVYAVPCDGNKVKNVIIHNRMIDTDVCVAAVTINENNERLFPEMLIPEKEDINFILRPYNWEKK